MKRPHFALPEIYDDSLSYYDVLRKLIKSMYAIVDNLNKIPEQIANEAKAREQGDTTLRQSITDETSAREQGDQEIREGVSNKISELKGDIAESYTSVEENLQPLKIYDGIRLYVTSEKYCLEPDQYMETAVYKLLANAEYLIKGQTFNTDARSTVYVVSENYISSDISARTEIGGGISTYKGEINKIYELTYTPDSDCYLYVQKQIATTSFNFENSVFGLVKKLKVDVVDKKVDDLDANITDRLLNKQDNLYYDNDVTDTADSGLIKRDMSVYADNNAKHIVLSVQQGEIYIISGSSNNAYYAGAWFRKNGVNTTFLFNGNGEIFEDYIVRIPADVDTLVVNGHNSLHVLKVIKKIPFSNSDLKQIYDNKESITDTNFEIENLERRVLKAEKGNDFAWKSFDKPYFVFFHDDTNSYTEEFANIFASNNAPLCESVIVSNIPEHIDTLRSIVSNGGELFAHYDASPNEATPDSDWYSYTAEVKREIESYGFDCRGIVRANSTVKYTNKGEKYCRRYFDYAMDGVGISEQYKLKRILILNYSNLDAMKNAITTSLASNGFYAFGFHGGRSDESWFTADAISEIVAMIKSGGGEIVNMSYLFDTFGTTALEKRLSALENS